MNLNNLALIFFIIVFGIFFNKYFLLFLYKYNPKLLIDDQFKKPQAFHEIPVSTTGGAYIFLSLSIIFFYFLAIKNIVYLEYMLFCTLFFLLGFLDDIQIDIKPRIRLIFMIVILLILTKYSNFYIDRTGIEFLDGWLKSSNLFSLFFICLCFLFVINGANLIDGYNGLLGIHSLIILINLFIINYYNANDNLTFLIFALIVVILIFLVFNSSIGIPRFFADRAFVFASPFSSVINAANRTVTFAPKLERCRAITKPSPPLFPLPQKIIIFFEDRSGIISANRLTIVVPAFSIRTIPGIPISSIAHRSMARICLAVTTFIKEILLVKIDFGKFMIQNYHDTN